MQHTVFHRIITAIRRMRYPGSRRYWERRYATGGDSGAGSAGRLAAYKAEIVNDYLVKQRIRSMVEIGCGDGRQVLLGRYPQYTGLDISPSAIRRCRALFPADASRQFAVYDPQNFDPAAVRADLALSLEVLFHVTEDDLYRLYMTHLFASARRSVVIFAPDQAGDQAGPFPHIRFRKFTDDVPPGWRLAERLHNPHRDLSFSDFFFFEKG